MTPSVTVCIPTHNGAAHVEAAIASVLAQTLTDIEVLVSDDASTDDTLARVARFDDPRVRVLAPPPERGAAANFNHVVAHARGRNVKVMGQDDLLRPSCLERQAAVLDADPATVLVSARRQLLDHRGRPLLRARSAGRPGRVAAAAALRWIVASGSNPVGEPVAVLLRTDVMRVCGDFDPERGYVIDLDYWCRMLELGDLQVVDEILCAFRVSTTSWSSRLAPDQARQVRALFRGLRARHPDAVSVWVLAVGSVKAGLWGLARRLVYARLRLAEQSAATRSQRRGGRRHP